MAAFRQKRSFANCDITCQIGESIMLRTVFLSTIFMITHAAAEQGPLPIDLNPEKSRALGFELSVEYDPYAPSVLLVQLTGPKTIEENCTPNLVGMAVKNSYGATVVGYQTRHDWLDQNPRMRGHYDTKFADTMVLYIDYDCPNRGKLDHRRYFINSVAEYLNKENEN